MALIIVHPFFDMNWKTAISLSGRSYTNGLFSTVRRHIAHNDTNIVLYEETRRLSQTVQIFYDNDIIIPQNYIATAESSGTLESLAAEDKEDAFLAKLSPKERTDVVCAGSYIGIDCHRDTLINCLGRTVNRLISKGVICHLELSACLEGGVTDGNLGYIVSTLARKNGEMAYSLD